MTASAPDPSSGPPTPDPIGLLAAAELDQDLSADASDGRLTRWLHRARWGIRLLAAAVVGTGLLAVLASVLTWRDHPAVLVLAVVASLPAIVAPILVARRTSAMAEAAVHPQEVAREARDLLGRVTDAPELRDLAALVAARRGRASAATVASTLPRLGRLRGALRAGRLASSLIGRAKPDAQQHRLLVPFTPEALGSTWSAVGWTWTGWLLALVVLAGSVVGIVV